MLRSRGQPMPTFLSGAEAKIWRRLRSRLHPKEYFKLSKPQTKLYKQIFLVSFAIFNNLPVFRVCFAV